MVLHFIVFFPALVTIKKIDWEDFIFNHFILVTINFLLFYVVAFYIMPVMDNFRKRWFVVLIASLLLAVLFTYLRFRVEMYRTDYLAAGNDTIPGASIPVDYGFFGSLFGVYLQLHILTNVSIVVVAFAYRLLLLWFQQNKIRTELENQKLHAELSFLKMQINPHFLFNALNNIYSLAVTENSKKTGGSILKLSELIRYMLYEKEDNESKVSLQKEIHYINNYLDLEKLRHPGDIHVNFYIEGEADEKRIAPLLLFPIIENAFKHGILTEKNKPVNISLNISEHSMKFSISNFKNVYQKPEVGGIGLQNVKKRLDLIYGPNYKLDIHEDEQRFTTDLQLPL
jgi:two-component system LytT family sensor kinase